VVALDKKTHQRAFKRVREKVAVAAVAAIIITLSAVILAKWPAMR
jgi:hypothetical protein